MSAWELVGLVLMVYLGTAAVVVEVVCLSGRRRRRGDWFARQAGRQQEDFRRWSAGE